MSKALLPKIAAEGYCCVNGYLRLCQARGESRKSMCENLALSRDTLSHNYQMLAKGKRPCMKFSDCMEPIIREILDEKKGEGDLIQPPPNGD